jgi:hypothetical protein
MVNSFSDSDFGFNPMFFVGSFNMFLLVMLSNFLQKAYIIGSIIVFTLIN